MNRLASNIFFLVFLFSCSHGSAQTEFAEITDFGANPGKLKMFIYVPKTISEKFKVPVVVVLHGCSQDAKEMAEQSGWNELAKKYKFIVVYPQQRRINNTSNCFNWFISKDLDVENGETASIKNMIEHAAENNNIDSSQVFIYGASAGAAMSVSLLSNFPCIFNSGAIYAGGPFGYANNAYKGLKLMNNPPDYSPDEWGVLLPEVNNFECKPRLVVVHGVEDNVVKLQNSKELIDQWSYLHQTDNIPDKTTDSFALNSAVTRSVYNNANEEEVIVYYEIENIGHALAVDPGEGENQGGTTGLHADDIDFYSTFYIAKDFGLIK